MRKHYIILALFILMPGIGISILNAHRVPTIDNSIKSTKSITAGCVAASASAYLEINNVRALINNGGDMWWDLTGMAKYEVPKGSGKTSLFAGALWIGGIDQNGQLYLAAQRFRENGVDYWPGPLKATGSDSGTTTISSCLQYDRIYNVFRGDVQTFRAWYNSPDSIQQSQFPNYTIPPSITEWPAHGDVLNDYSNFLAPFYDNNSDNVYNPADGDYPYFDLDGTLSCNSAPGSYVPHLQGDQCLWYVFNDAGNSHSETGGNTVGVEIHSQAFAFSTSDEDLNNATFYNYEIINRSSRTYLNTYIGVWSDADLGYADDDFVGCDVSRGLGYLYNGDEIDGTGHSWAYGAQPPAIGIDFFEGPYMDADGVDNLSSWSATGTIDCLNGYGIDTTTGVYGYLGAGDILNGNINGLNFGDGIVDNERWGMRRFMYFTREGNPFTTDPGVPVHYYNYLLGIWKNNANLCYGGTGFPGEPGTSTIATDFVYPYDSDPCGWGQGGTVMTPWSEETVSSLPGDRRFVQSAGPITFEPGEVNTVTFGAVWARDTSALASVEALKIADDKIQALFESCFQVLTPPNAPDIEIISQDHQLSFNIWNTVASNNYLESYSMTDEMIVCPNDNPSCDKTFNFQGYIVYQLKDSNVTQYNLDDTLKAKIIFQCDLYDTIDTIINYCWSQDSMKYLPVIEVVGNNQGIAHNFNINFDAFSPTGQSLVNFKKYYYMAISYAYNNYEPFDPQSSSSDEGQKKCFLPSVRGVNSAIKIYQAIPMPYDATTYENYGAQPAITQYDGHGNANNPLDLYDETIDKIMSGPPWKADTLKYKPGKGPIAIKVIDPLNVHIGEYEIRMCTDSLNINENYVINYFSNKYNYDYNFQTGFIISTKWYAVDKPGVDNGSDTIGRLDSDEWISTDNEQIIPQLGISITINQGNFPLKKQTIWTPNQCALTLTNPPNNGLLGASIEFSDPSKEWLYFIPDNDEPGAFNWIRSGTYQNLVTGGWPGGNDVKFPSPATFADPDEIFEKIIVRELPIAFNGTTLSGGTWAPYRLCSYNEDGAAYSKDFNLIKLYNHRLSSVNIVITPDKTKWSRCPVIELSENVKTEYDSSNPGNLTDLLISGKPVNYYSQGNVVKFGLRSHLSIDKDGKTVDTGGSSGTGENDCNYISPTGMGWFPGYAIDMETGERLNMLYGEDSYLPGENGQDMIWNPTNRIATNLYWATNGDTSAGKILFGGKHYIYVMGHNIEKKSITGGIIAKTLMKSYDAGDTIRSLLDPLVSKSKEVMMNAMWVAMPILNPAYNLLDCDVTIKLQVTNPYERNMGSKMTYSDSIAPNGNFPMYSFSTSDLVTATNKPGRSIGEIDFCAVPNPFVKFTALRINNIPANTVGEIKFYDLSGGLVFTQSVKLSAGSNDVNIKFSFKPGVYIGKLTTTNKRISRKIIAL